MFDGATSFNGDLNNWNTSRVGDMEGMFYRAISFNRDLDNWDKLSVTNMWGMFSDATSFNDDLSNWDTSSVINMRRMFNGATSFNQDLCAWGDTFTYGKDDLEIFKGSNCTFEDNPQLGQRVPFCASSRTKESGPTSRPSPSHTVR